MWHLKEAWIWDLKKSTIVVLKGLYLPYITDLDEVQQVMFYWERVFD